MWPIEISDSSQIRGSYVDFVIRHWLHILLNSMTSFNPPKWRYPIHPLLGEVIIVQRSDFICETKRIWYHVDLLNPLEGLHHLLRPPGPGRRRHLQRLHRRRLHHCRQALFWGEHCRTSGRCSIIKQDQKNSPAIHRYFQAMLVGGICPGTEDPALCEENLPEFWSMVAAVLWPGYWDPTVSWIF